MRYTIFGLIWIVSGTAVAGIPSVEWNDGALVLKNSEVMVGEVFVHEAFDMVLFRSEEGVAVYPAHKLTYVQLYDRNEDVNRRYITRLEVQHGQKKHHLFEVVVFGDISVLRKLKGVGYSGKSHKNDFDYYIVANDQLFHLKQFHNKVFPSIESIPHVVEFMEERNLNSHYPADAIRVIAFYNELVRAELVKPEPLPAATQTYLSQLMY